MVATPYTAEFYDERGLSHRSAEVIVPMVLDLVAPSSVADVGCGTGEFLAVVREHGVRDVLGIDGAWVERSRLEIPPTAFRSADLEQPLSLGRRFDLLLSLEVAEHLPESAAWTFVTSLVSLAPVVVFSAAIPGQGGTHHVNEQWPAYWAAQFVHHGYTGFDPFRRALWDEHEVAVWYRQNIVLFVADEHLRRSRRLRKRLRDVPTELQALVHPGVFQAKLGELA